MTDFYDDLADLTQVDWPLMNARYWFDTVQDPDRRRQAAFLVHERFPVKLIQLIGVMSPLLKQQVKKSAARCGYGDGQGRGGWRQTRRWYR